MGKEVGSSSGGQERGVVGESQRSIACGVAVLGAFVAVVRVVGDVTGCGGMFAGMGNVVAWSTGLVVCGVFGVNCRIKALLLPPQK